MGEDTGREERKTYNYKSVSDIFQIKDPFSSLQSISRMIVIP